MSKTNIKIAIGDLIKHFRTEKGLSQEKLAGLSGLHRTYIGALERGEKTPTIPTLQKITESLEITLVEFFSQLEKKD